MEEQNTEEQKPLENGDAGFKALGLPEHILKSIKDKGFEKPTEIQEKSVPLVMEGKDVIARASTGSGKTLAFASIILRDTKKGFGIQALVLTPTRELAEQVRNEIAEFSRYNHLKIIPVYGGVSINEQIRELRSADIVVGTPGRILDHVKRNTINLSPVKILVLDEADRMLDMGFITDVEKIIGSCPKKRQTLLFSATMPKEIVHISKSYMSSPIEVSAGQYVDPTKLKQEYYEVEDKLKFALLKHLLENENSELAMVFCNTRRKADLIAKNLNFYNIDASPIHGGLSQDKRSNVMQKFHSQHIKVLVCTDIAARGLDIPKVTHIYNFDIPHDPKDYIHRIGRTARAGEEGKAISIVGPEHADDFNAILRNKKIEIKKQTVPAIESIILQRRIRQGSEERGGWQRREGNRGRRFNRSSGRREHRGGDKGWRFERKEGERNHENRREGGFGRREDRRGGRFNRSPGRGCSRFGKRDNQSRQGYGDKERNKYSRSRGEGENSREGRRESEGYRGKRRGFIRRDDKRTGSRQNSFRRRERRY